MNIITFDYTKADGKTSKRVLSPVITPNTMYEGTDISELSMAEQVDYVQQLDNIKEFCKKAILELNNSFDVNNRYRRFDPSKMANVVKESL